MTRVLTNELSTIWTPHQVRANVFMTASISASSWYGPNDANWGPYWVTGSNLLTPQATRELGMPPSRFRWATSTKSGWLNIGTDDTDAALYFDLDNGTGRKEVVNNMIIGNFSQAAYNCQGYAISGSQDKITWTPLTSSGASYGTPAKGFNATMPFSNTTAYRYYKVKMLGTAGAYDGFTNIWAWDVNKFTGGGSTHGSASVNLFNPYEANVTASFRGEVTSQTSLAKLASPERENFGWYWDDDIGTMDMHWGDGPKLIRGMLCCGYDTDDYVPSKWQVYSSNTGNFNDWKLVNTIDFNAQQDHAGFEFFFLDFGTPIKTQYLRMAFYEEYGETTDVQTTISYANWMYEMVSASAPPAPTDLITVAQNSNVALTWAQAGGKDNRSFDIFYNIERSDNAGSSYTKIATISGSFIPSADTGSSGTNTPTYYVDTSVADGDYLYRVQAANIHHLTTGSYVTSDSITLPPPGSPKVYITNQGNVMLNPNDTTLIELS